MWRKIRFSQSNSTSGFTLLEVLVVVVIAGVLAAIAAPSWLAYTNRQRMNRARGDLFQILQTAQSEAQQTNTDRVVNIDSSSGVPVVTVASSVGSLATGFSQEIGGEQNGQLTFETATTVTFDFRGTVETAPITFSVMSENLPSEKRCVVITTVLGSMTTARDADCN